MAAYSNLICVPAPCSTATKLVINLDDSDKSVNKTDRLDLFGELVVRQILVE